MEVVDVTKPDKDRVETAKRSLQEMEDRIAPFAPKREQGERITVGRWRDTRSAVASRARARDGAAAAS